MAIFKRLKKKTIGFWAGDQNNFQFLDPLIQVIGKDYSVKKFDFVDNTDKLLQEMNSVDVAWFEWGNGPIVSASQLSEGTPIINRIHRYELYTDSPAHINWKNVDNLLFSSPSMIHKFKQKFPEALKEINPEFLPIGVDLDLFVFNDKKFTKNLVYVGRIHPHKNPSMLLQLMAKIVSKDPEYKLTIIGSFHDELYEEYYYDQVKKLSLTDNITYINHMPHKELVKYIQNSDYFLITSIIEGLSQASLEAMACGATPVINNYFGCEYAYPKKHIYNTIDQAADMILKPAAKRYDNREFIINNHDLNKTNQRVKEIIEGLLNGKN